MIHDDKDEFLKILERVSAQTGFPLYLLEKDYYLTLILSEIKELDGELVFKGGTCLNKIYYSYFRLSTDLDFTLKPPKGGLTRAGRSKAIKPIKAKISHYLKRFGLGIKETEQTGRNESTQYIFYADYKSVVLGADQQIKIEIGLRADTLLPTLNKKAEHKFLHPFTLEPLFESGEVRCLALKELVAEKLRAASTRKDIAPRDFYDISYLIKTGFKFKDEELNKLFRKKLEEDKKDTDLKKYRANLGRTKEEIDDMSSRIEAELLDVLSMDERKSFNMGKALDLINETLRQSLG